MNEYGYRSSSGEGLRVLAAAVTVVGAVAVLGVSAYDELAGTSRTVQGTVLTGADGKKYIVPNGAEQPIYPSQQACEDDVKKHEAAIKAATGNTVDPRKVCQPVSHYHAIRLYHGTDYVGPMVGSNGEWNSAEMVTWSPARNGTFAASGEPTDDLPDDVAVAPKGAVDGEHESTTVHEPGHFGGGGGEDHPHVSVHVE